MSRNSSIDQKPVVAHLNHQFFAATETFIYTYLSHLQRLQPICLSQSEAIANTDVFPFPPADLYDNEVRGAKRYTARWLYLGIRQRLQRQLQFLQPNGERWAVKILRKRNAKLIHAHFGPRGLAALPIKKKLGLPLITTFYGFDLKPDLGGKYPNYTAGRQELFKTGDLFLVEGAHMRQLLIDLGCPAEKIKIQRIAIETAKLPFRARLPKPNQKTRILFIGRFYEKKGLLYALQAVYDLWKIRQDFEFRLVGDGELGATVRAFIHDHTMESYVNLLGFLNRPACLAEMQTADIFLHPSVTAANGDTEGGAPTVILEAQALGIPVVSTLHADIPNVTVPGKSALLVAERDIPALVDALRYLLDNPTYWAEMGQAGREFVEKHHEIDREVKALETIYLNLIESPQRVAA